MIFNIQLNIPLGILLICLSLSVFAEKSIEEKWLDAVSKGNVKEAIKVASQMVPQSSLSEKIDPKYTALVEQEKVDVKFLKSPFNQLDFKLWYDAWFLKNKLKEFGIFELTNDIDKLKLILNKVANRIDPKEKEHAIISWPTGIWIRRFGLCDRQSWLFAELAYQAGYETQVVYLINPSTGESPHTICEVIVKEEEKRTITKNVVDSLNKLLLPNISVTDLLADKNLMKKIWPEKKEWWNSLGSSIFWTPSYPQDYCEKNQVLYEKLKNALGERCPRFGEDPKLRLLNYHKSDKNKSFKKDLWFYPFRLLKIEMDIKKGKSERKK